MITSSKLYLSKQTPHDWSTTCSSAAWPFFLNYIWLYQHNKRWIFVRLATKNGHCPWIMLMPGDPYTRSVLFLMWGEEKKSSLGAQGLCPPRPSSLSLFHFFMFSVSLWSTRIFANSITLCESVGCTNVCVCACFWLNPGQMLLHTQKRGNGKEIFQSVAMAW